MSKKKKPQIVQKNNKKKLSKTSSKNKVVMQKKESKLETFFVKHSFLSLMGLILLIGIFAFKDYLFVKYVYFFKDIGSDTLNNIYPQKYLISKLTVDAWYSTWSFNIGMGQIIFSGIPVFANPLYYFNWLIELVSKLIFDENWFVYGRFWTFFFGNFFVSGLLFYFYLRSISVEKFTSVIGALFVAFLGYAILGSSWGHTSVLSTVVLLFATEQLLSKNRWYFFPLAVTYISSNPFLLYLNVLFISIYIVFRFFFFEKNSVKKYLINGAKMILLGAFGILLNLVNILTHSLRMFNSPRVSGGVGYFDKLSSTSLFSTESISYGGGLSHHLTAMYRLFSNDILGNGSNFKGWYNYLEAPVLYAGLLTLLLVPQLFHFVNTKKKITLASFLGFWGVIVIFPFFRYAFNAFSGDYYKIGLDVFIPLSLIILAFLALNFIYKQTKINVPTLLVTLFILLAALYLPDMGTRKSIVVSSVRNWVSLFLIFYTIALIGFRNFKYRNYSLAGILVLVILEITTFSYRTVNERKAYSSKEFEQTAGGYFDKTVDAVNYIDSLDSSFFRLEKDYWSGTSQHGSLNDAKVQNYYGTTSYASFNQGNYIRFLQEAGVIDKENETQTRWSPGLRGQPILSTWGNIKYFLTKNEKSNFLQIGYSKIAQKGDVLVLKNNYYLPMGYTYSSYLKLDEFRQLPKFQKDLALLNAVVLDDEQIAQLHGELQERTKTDSSFAITEAVFGKDYYQFSRNDFLKDTSAKAQKSMMANFRDKLMEDTLKITAHGQDFIDGTISLKKAKLLFLTIPYDKGWEVTVNGKKQETIKSNIGFTGILLPAGDFEIKFHFLPVYFTLCFWITIVSNILFVLLVVAQLIYNKRARIYTAER